MVFGYAQSISGVKNNSIIQKGPKKQGGHQSRLESCTIFFKWYAILKSALSLLKPTVLINMYVFVTSKHVNDNSCIYSFPEAIFKMLVMENDKKPKFGLSIFQLLFVLNLQYLPRNAYFWEWQTLSD